MDFAELYRSVFAILRIEGQNARVVGTGFVINTNPIYILTCNHVVSEVSENNNGNIVYSITKRSDNVEEFDLRQIQISFLRATQIVTAPQFDLAILKIDPNDNAEVARLLSIDNAPALQLSFDQNDRTLGGEVEWLSTAATADLTLTPRFFKGNIVTQYIVDHQYNYLDNNGQQINQVILAAKMIEVDKLFIPGSSGSPILDTASNKVIAFVHGFKSWPIGTNTEVQHPFQLVENNTSREMILKYNLPFVTSLSLGIDVRTIETFLRENNFLPIEDEE
jgi:S1-C subfamily serine protease